MAQSKRPRRPARVREEPAPQHAAPAADRRLTRVVLDSDVIIEVLRGRRSVIEEVDGLERSGAVTLVTPISLAEIFAGVRPGEEATTEAFFAARGILSLDAGVGRRAGQYLSRYNRSHGVEIADALIAAATSRSGAILWTLNRKHYPMDDVRFFDAPA